MSDDPCSNAFHRPGAAGRHLRPRPGRQDRRGRLRRRPAPLARFRIQPGVRRIPRLHARRRPAARRLERVRPHRARYLKRYRGETNSQLTLLLDTSASMGYTSHGDHQAGLRALPGRLAGLPGQPAARCRGPHRFRRRRAQLRPALHAAGPVHARLLHAHRARRSSARAPISPSRSSIFSSSCAGAASWW